MLPASRSRFSTAISRADVVLVQADGRLVEDVERVDQPGTQGPGHRHPAQLAAGEGAAGPVEREVVEPDPAQVIEPLLDLVEDPRGHLVLRAGRSSSPRAGGPRGSSRPTARRC